ncbi:DNA alkylation repair protein [Thalassospira sp. TSL5-1]|uniref:DNA alkylation repair protein n=1 Tax=Thalassospira sp. TSL5-1 TaxID=1544451 RepID=UPI00093CAF2F|nr:hypothetical protein [Thalassospira sp. TSL5-1]OKH89823.1 hypothetical protein LF95_07930 [Thalassospira sp. TSL5-1]
MGTPFKELFSKGLIAEMATHILRVYPEFDDAGFMRDASKDLDALELKQRSNQVLEALTMHLPTDFSRAVAIINQSLAPAPGGDFNDITDPKPDVSGQGVRGWAIMPMADYVALHGQDNLELSMDSLYQLTQRFSSEFAIRPFLANHTSQTLAILSHWVDDPNAHVRRLVSEGTRTRLPWGMRLSVFIEDPSPVIALLTRLRDDRAEYVRRSVANNLNDIAKDHPDLVAEIAAEWLRDAPKNRQRLVHHACRSLVKQGHEGALSALGFGPVQVVASPLRLKNSAIEMGHEIAFAIDVKNDEKKTRELVIDYAIHHRKANGSLSPKVFKWKKLRLKAGESISLARTHRIYEITTRKYYPGLHMIEVLVNGISVATEHFDLQTG